MVAVVFLITNREPVTLDFWTFELQLSLHWILLACVAFGVVVGSMATWLSAAPARRRARQARRRVAELERAVNAGAANAAAVAVDSGQPGLPSLAPGAPKPERRSALGR
jgi:membrane protein YqaA with SNARE-associated domain